MTNYQVYKKTLSFSFVYLFVSLLTLAIVAGFAIGGYFLFNKATDMAILGLALGVIIGAIIGAGINFLIGNRIKAAWIAMMTKGVVDNELPESTFKAGFEELHGRFGKITVFFMVTNAIKGIFRQIGRSINRIGTAVGGDTGNTVTSVIDSAIQTLIGYLCDCCLGYVMYNKDKGVSKAATEGAVIFFKHGKTLLKNVGRIFGIGLASLALIGGLFFLIFYLIFRQFPQVWQNLSLEMIEIAERGEGNMSDFISNPTNLMLFIAGISALLIWSTIHSVLIRPFILVGVLRNYMVVAQKEELTDKDFESLEKKSPRFAKLRQRED